MGLSKAKCLQGKQTKLIGLWKVEVGHKGICRLTTALIRIPNPNWELAEHKPFIFYVLMGFFTGVQKKKKNTTTAAWAEMGPVFAALSSTVVIYNFFPIKLKRIHLNYIVCKRSGSSDEEQYKVGRCHSWSCCFASRSSALCLPSHADVPPGFVH